MIDAYVKDGKLQKWLATQGISGSVWITNCKTGKGYVVNGTQTTASTTSKTQADAIVNGKKFNGDIGISACYDPDTKQWTINHSFKDGVLKPPSKYAGELEKLKATSDQYVENVINKKNAEANKTPGTGSSAAVGTDPDFKYADLGILEAVLMVKDFTKQIVNTAKVPEEYWDETKPEYQTSPVHAPALFCGAGDQGLENATELVQLLDLGLTLATEPETASQMWSSIKNIKWQDVQKLAGDATGYANYAQGGCFAKYQGGKHAVVIAFGLAAIAGKTLKTILSKLDEGVEGAIKKADDNLGEAVGKTSDEIITINKTFVNNPFDEAGKLKPNVRYKTGEFDYFGETDNLGRLDKFDTENLQLTKRPKRLPHNADSPGKLPGDHAGHIFADRFGGSRELDNIVSQLSEVNQSKFATLENRWTKAIKSGQTVEVKIKINYKDNDLRPSSFDIEYSIDGDLITLPPILNN